MYWLIFFFFFFFFVIIEHTYGFHRAEVIAALISVLTIWVLTGLLLKEAIERLHSPQVIDAKLVSDKKIMDNG
jgi:hypothetical protein